MFFLLDNLVFIIALVSPVCHKWMEKVAIDFCGYYDFLRVDTLALEVVEKAPFSQLLAVKQD